MIRVMMAMLPKARVKAGRTKCHIASKKSGTLPTTKESIKMKPVMVGMPVEKM
jgi:hypothetical protein